MSIQRITKSVSLPDPHTVVYQILVEAGWNRGYERKMSLCDNGQTAMRTANGTLSPYLSYVSVNGSHITVDK